MALVDRWPRLLALLLAALLVNVQPSTAQPSSPAPPRAPTPFAIAGLWQATYGDITFTQKPDGSVSGTYGAGDDAATITGTLAGRTLTFTYKERAAAGEGVFEFAPDGLSFTGTWREQGAQKWSSWTGRRDDANTFTGLWKTTYGPMRLAIASAQGSQPCAGIYQFDGQIAEIRGSIDARTFTFTYTEPDGVTGQGWFTLAESGDEFAGEWKTAAMDKPKSWAGTRVKPKPGVTWLIVLEAHWEHALTDQEFSYGQMLRSFFQRIPSVAFRHRFIHDKADVKRFAGEVRFIAEPVVLYFSSHGTREGISVSDGTATPEEIAGALRGASNIRLLHFGACEVMAGDAPARLTSALKGTASFPISGFANTADWGGSAIVDFTYLDLILEHKLDPAAAVTETCRSLSFAHRPGTQGADADRGVIAPSFLTIYPSTPVAGSAASK